MAGADGARVSIIGFVMRRVVGAGILQFVSLVALAVLSSGSAEAQGFFESLFGGGQKQPAEMPQRPISLPPPLFRTPLGTAPRERGDDKAEQSQKLGSGRYRTLCVRTCDGYYFPISNATTRSGFYKDAKICKASCGEDAKLYFVDKNDTDNTDMVDVTGRPYARLQTAFLYRKRQIEGCKCKPDPWSQSELDRHRSYAVAETVSGMPDTVKKKALGPSDPAVRAALERQEQSKGGTAATVEAQAADTASEAGTKPATDEPKSDAAGEPNDSSKSDGSKAPASPASEPEKPAPKSKPPSVKPDKRAPYHAAASGSARASVVPASAQPGYTPLPAAKSLFGLGGPSQRWPGE